MKALLYDSAAGMRLADVPAPRGKRGEALIRVLLAGICNTDLEIMKGYMGYSGVLGHEFVGRVESAPSAALRGRRVVGEINLACGRCGTCGRGMKTHCPARRVLGIAGKEGCFAEFVTLPLENLHVVPDGVPDECAVFTEPLAAAFRILEQVRITGLDRVAVLGDGKLGLLVAMVLREFMRGQRGEGFLLAAGRHPKKLAILRKLGIKTALAPPRPAEKFDIVVDCTGSAQGFGDALALTRPQGTLVLKSTVAGETALNLSPVVIHEVRIVGSRCGPFETALRTLAERKIDPRPLIEKTYSLADGVAAMEHAARRGAMKILLRAGR
jgi:threonine dehydrogenase-like Zn-dependent dehydrogenase